MLSHGSRVSPALNACVIKSSVSSTLLDFFVDGSHV